MKEKMKEGGVKLENVRDQKNNQICSVKFRISEQMQRKKEKF